MDEIVGIEVGDHKRERRSFVGYSSPTKRGCDAVTRTRIARIDEVAVGNDRAGMEFEIFGRKIFRRPVGLDGLAGLQRVIKDRGGGRRGEHACVLRRISRTKRAAIRLAGAERAQCQDAPDSGDENSLETHKARA